MPRGEKWCGSIWGSEYLTITTIKKHFSRRNLLQNLLLARAMYSHPLPIAFQHLPCWQTTTPTHEHNITSRLSSHY
jgi:hypothetical protein